MLSLRTISTRSCFNLIPKSLLHTTNITWNATSRSQLKKDLIKESGVKRPATAFILFTKAKRSALKSEHPELTPTQVATELGSKWSSLSEQEKKPFIDQYNENYKDYKSLMSQLENKLPPKRPGNAYIIYVNEVLSDMKDQYPDLEHTEIIRKIGENWKNLADQEKVRYEQIYKQKIAEWKKQTNNV